MSQLSTVKTFIEGRLDEISNVRKLVSLLKDTTDYMSSSFVTTVSEKIDIDSDLDFKAATAELNTVVAQLVKEVPERIKSASYEEDTLYSQMMAMTQQMLFSNSAAENIEGLMGIAAKELHSEVASLEQEALGLRSDLFSFWEEFNTTVADTPNPEGIDVTKIQEQLYRTTTDAKRKLVELQNRIAIGSDFSQFRIDEIVSILSNGKNTLPSSSLIPAFSGTALSLLGKVQSLNSKLDKAYSKKNSIANMREEFISKIKPGDIFKQNFSKIYSLLGAVDNNAEALSSLAGGDTISALSSVKNKLNSISGLIATLGTKKFTNSLSDNNNQSVKNMIGFKELMGDIPNTLSNISSLERHTKSLIKSAERYINGTLPKEAPGLLDNLKSTAETIFNSVISDINTFKTILNVFDPEPTTDIMAYMNSIGSVAPAARDALLTGDLAAFSNTLKGPAFLTVAGQAIGALNSFASTNVNKLNVQDRNMIGIVTSYLAGEHKRAMMAMWTSNVAAQRSRTLTSLDITVNKFIRPIELLVKTLEDKFNV